MRAIKEHFSLMFQMVFKPNGPMKREITFTVIPLEESAKELNQQKIFSECYVSVCLDYMCAIYKGMTVYMCVHEYNDQICT